MSPSAPTLDQDGLFINAASDVPAKQALVMLTKRKAPKSKTLLNLSANLNKVSKEEVDPGWHC